LPYARPRSPLPGLRVGIEGDVDVLACEVVAVLKLEGSEKVVDEVDDLPELVEIVEVEQELDEELEDEVNEEVEGEVKEVLEELDFGDEVDTTDEAELGDSEAL
jgi:hypothetical protein